jgi:hypothetical protein
MRIRFPRLHLRPLMAVLAVLVAGCETLDFLNTPQPASTPAPVAQSAPPAAAVTPPPGRVVRVAPPPPRPTPLPEIKAPELKVVGLSQTETETLLGSPDAALDRPPAKVWQYKAPDCAVDIYFYLDVGRNAFYALHYDSPAPNSSGTQATASATDAADRCLRRVYNAHRER